MVFGSGRFIGHIPVSGYIGDSSDNKGIWSLNENNNLKANNKLTPPITLIGSVLGSGSATNVQRVIFPAHQNGDWLFAAVGTQSTVQPSAPAGWTTAVWSGSISTRGTVIHYIVSDGTISSVDFPMVGASSLLYSAGIILRNVGGIGNTGSRANTGVVFPAVTLQRTNNTSRVISAHFFQNTINGTTHDVPGFMTGVQNNTIMAITTNAVSQFPNSPLLHSNTVGACVSVEILKA